MTRAALLQLTSSDDPATNLAETLRLIDEAAQAGAEFLLTPEVTNCVSSSRSHQQGVLAHQENDATLAGVREAAKRHGIWIALGSIGLKTDDADGRFANRSFLIAPDGSIKAWYDKIHMFDVEIGPGESYRESAGYRPGDRAVVAETPFGVVGLSVCYDVRFAALYRTLAKAGAQILLVPAAFSPVTGAAHWETLLRARAIETGCFVLAAAQCGEHSGGKGKPRRTHGHSLAVAPWGEVLADGGTEPGITYVDIDVAAVDEARKRVPSIDHDRPFGLVQ